MSKHWNHFVTWVSNWHIWQLWNPANLFQVTPPYAWGWMKAYLVLTGLFFLIGIVSLFRPTYQPVRQRLSVFCWTNAIIGVILFFLRYQDIPLLGMDIFRFAQEVIALIWGLWLLRFSIREYPRHNLEQKVIERKNKYLPKPKA